MASYVYPKPSLVLYTTSPPDLHNFLQLELCYAYFCSYVLDVQI